MKITLSTSTGGTISLSILYTGDNGIVMDGGVFVTT